MTCGAIRMRGLPGIPEIQPGADLAGLLESALAGMLSPSHQVEKPGPIVLVIAQKVVSKAEGCIVRLDEVNPSAEAVTWARRYHKDPRIVEVVLRQARRIVRMDRGIIIAETHHGFVCANAGVDASNAPGGTVILLPPDPDRSASGLRNKLEGALRRPLAVIVADTFGRPWRTGLTNVALGISGLSPFLDYRGQVDSYGRTLRATVIAVADELAGAAELVMGKSLGIPAVVIEGYRYPPGEGSGNELIRPEQDDLFR
jgi:coenzyme F420-0:L-glutamate ligase / coenzyme F420-1:gamma-L-glutamate ligase